MSENPPPGLPARAPKERDATSSVKAADIPVERLQQVKDAVASVSGAAAPTDANPGPDPVADAAADADSDAKVVKIVAGPHD